MDAATKSPRLDPLPPAHSPELKAEFDSFFKSLGFVPNSVLTMQRKPKLVRAFVAMQGSIWDPESKVDRGFKRILAHLASRTAQDEYSMAHTASGALHFGVGEARLKEARNYKTSALYTPAEKAALDIAVAAGQVPNAVTDAMFVELRKHWSEEQIVEIVSAVAMAGFLARWNTTMATPLEDEAREVGEKHLAAQGWTGGVHRR
ncbi:MAG TPA: carboxymuconolactone decarboxylase family protein [Xanthobacteraceae bacterium]|nr:carboxymuconolactone decarboxylase family protein [Xanthobacteraceae bacterium]